MAKGIKRTVTSSEVHNAIIDDVIRENPDSALNKLPRALVPGTTVNGQPVTESMSNFRLNEINGILSDPSNTEIYNAWIGAFINKVAYTQYQGIREYRTPSSLLDKGVITNGGLIEDIMIGLAKPVQYKRSTPNTAENIFKAYDTNVDVDYYGVNYQIYYPVTVYRNYVSMFFRSNEGVRNFVDHIIMSAWNANARDVDLAKRYVIAQAIIKGYVGVKNVPTLNADNATLITSDIKALMADMEFYSSGYNKAGVPNFVPPEDMYFIITAEYAARYTVEVQASAFNLDKVDYMGKRVLVRSFAFTEEELEWLDELFEGDSTYVTITPEQNAQLKNVLAIACDRLWTQFYTNFEITHESFNPTQLNTNFFIHDWRWLYLSSYSNAVAIISSEAGIVDVTVSPTAVTIAKGGNTQLTANVESTGFASKAVTWEITTPTNKSFVSQTGVVQVGADETLTSFVVKVTSAVDINKYATCTVTVQS